VHLRKKENYTKETQKEEKERKWGRKKMRKRKK
jgi:hypothetical protein